MCASGERDTQLTRQSCESVAPPTVAERNGDGEGLWPTPTRHAIEITDDLGEEIVGIELLDRGCEECAGPGQLRRACREVAHGTRTELRPPPLGVQLLLGANGVFEVVVDVDGPRAARMHGYTSSA